MLSQEVMQILRVTWKSPVFEIYNLLENSHKGVLKKKDTRNYTIPFIWNVQNKQMYGYLRQEKERKNVGEGLGEVFSLSSLLSVKEGVVARQETESQNSKLT